MARIAVRRLFADAPQAADVTEYRWYYGQIGVDMIAAINIGGVKFFTTPSPQLLVGDAGATGVRGVDLPEGTYQFAVTALDGAGNESDPYQHPDWVDVDIDVTPPDPPTGGGIELFAA